MVDEILYDSISSLTLYMHTGFIQDFNVETSISIHPLGSVWWYALRNIFKIDALRLILGHSGGTCIYFQNHHMYHIRKGDILDCHRPLS